MESALEVIIGYGGNYYLDRPTKEHSMKTLVTTTVLMTYMFSALGSVFAQPGPSLDPISPSSIDPERELVITDLSVIEHPILTDPTSDTPYWTFKYLMEQMSINQDTLQFVQTLSLIHI